MDFQVLYEDNHILVANKPNNMLVQPDTTGDVALEDLAKQYIKVKYNKPGAVFLNAVHRIDRPVSGVVVFARTSKALARLNEQFRSKEIKKTYWALVKNRPEIESGTLENYIRRDAKKNKSFVCQKEAKDAKLARLSYTLIASSENYHLLEIDLHTGRHHQIRCQLAHMGCPIKGDLKYGAERSNKDGGISLHARSVEFTHPVTKEPIKITAPVPNDNLWQAMENCRG
ncbi:MAG: RluA family pseudouridine synthase [Bacteroidales bacterium]|nr:RluA family pseudouridine synthase [Bacteroidales bacterium]